MNDDDIRGPNAAHPASVRRTGLRAGVRDLREDGVLEYPQSGERIRTRTNIQATHAPADGEVFQETQYFCDPFPASEWPSRWVEYM
jgi:hypothetical protein